MGSSPSRDGSSENVQGSGNIKLTKKDLRWFIKEIKEHESGINSVCVTPDNSAMITASEDATARVFDLKTEEYVSVLRGHEKYINHVVCNADFVFTASADKTIRKWRLDTGICSKTMKGHTGAVNRLHIVNNILFSSSYDRSVRCWHVDTGECKAVFEGHKLGVYPILYVEVADDEFDRDFADLENNHDLLITGSVDSTAKSWTLSTGDVQTTFRGHTGAVLSLATDNQGSTLFTGSQDNTIRSYDLHTGKILKVFEGHQAAILQLQVCNYVGYLFVIKLSSWIGNFSATELYMVTPSYPGPW